MSADPPLLLVWENQRRVLARPGMWTTLGLAFGIPSARSIPTQVSPKR